MSFLLFAHCGALFFMHNHNKIRFILQFVNKITLYLPSLFWLLLIYGFDSPCIAGLTVISAIIHECGHCAYLLLRKDEKSRLVGNLSGFRISRTNTVSYVDDALLYASGPMANFAASIFALCFAMTKNNYIFLFAIINLATAFSNLLPIKGYDGYGIMRSLLCLNDKWDKLQSIFECISLLFVAFILFLSLYVMARIGDGYWTTGLFLLSLIKEVSEGLKKAFS